MALEGQIVRFREEREEDLQFLIDLRNDLDTQGFTKTLPTDYTLPMYLKRFQEREFSFDRDDGRLSSSIKRTVRLSGTSAIMASNRANRSSSALP